MPLNVAKETEREIKTEVKKGLDQLDRGEGRPLDVEALKKRLRFAIGRRPKKPRPS